MTLSSYKKASWAKGYRKFDEEAIKRQSWKEYSENLRRITESFQRQISVLDVGCGTGRFFCSLMNVDLLYGLDSSEAMLNEAKIPVNKDQVEKNIKEINLVKADINDLAKVFDLNNGIKFDFIFSIGLLSEYGPTTEISVEFFNDVDLLINHGGIVWLSISKSKECIMKILEDSNLSKNSKIKFSYLTDDKDTKTIVEIQKNEKTIKKLFC